MSPLMLIIFVAAASGGSNIYTGPTWFGGVELETYGFEVEGEQDNEVEF